MRGPWSPPRPRSPQSYKKWCTVRIKWCTIIYSAPLKTLQTSVVRARRPDPAPPAGPLTGRGAFEDFQEGCRVVAMTVGGGMAELADRYESASETAMGRRHRALAEAIQHLLSGQAAPPAVTTPEALQVWKDMALAALDSHEIARGESILFETSRLVFKLVLSHHDCHQGVSDGMRARVDAQDVVDRMVRVTKMLRGALVSALMRRSRKEMIALFLFNSSVFVRGRAPRALGLDVATRLPGELR